MRVGVVVGIVGVGTVVIGIVGVIGVVRVLGESDESGVCKSLLNSFELFDVSSSSTVSCFS